MQQRSSGIIRRRQRESLYLREAATLLQRAANDDIRIARVHITRAEFSKGDGSCYLYFTALGGKSEFEELLDVLKLYKPSLRAALARVRQSRKTPELVFKYDEALEKAEHMHGLLNKIAEAEALDSKE